MKLPFTTEEFFQVFADYNRSVPAASILLLAVAVVIVWALVRARAGRSRIVLYGLAVLWLWSGLVYHLIFFARINPAAVVFGLVFLAQGFWFFRAAGAVRSRTMSAKRPAKLQTVLGATIVSYALVGYPVVSFALGHNWPATPAFGVPCPVVIFTLGAALWLGEPLSKRLLIIPLAWAGVGITAALMLGAHEDWGLPVAGLLTGVFLWSGRGREQRPARKSERRPPHRGRHLSHEH